MADSNEENSSAVEELEPKAPTMAETEEHQPQQQHGIKKPEKMNISFSIWPPTQRTRDAVINRLIETLSTPSVLSKRYGSMPQEEASAAARRIEDEAFSAAAASASADDDGIEILQVYSKEISKRMLEAVKSRSASASTPDSNIAPQSPAVVPTSPASEEISPVEIES
uniref:Putative MFP1 attachment factor 1-like n=1 Tax=Davidia involucrata TaxID=16924 RepID=A0A5B7AWR0_DAVIN